MTNLHQAITWLKSVDWQDTGMGEPGHVNAILEALAVLPAQPLTEDELAHKLYMETPAGIQLSKETSKYVIRALRAAGVLYCEEK